MNVFRFLLIALLASSMWTSATSQSTLEKSLFWKINHPETEHTSYLFGTMHALPEDDFSIPDILREKIAEADVMYQEIDMASVDQMEVLNKMMLPEGKTLKQLLPEEEYKEFSAMLKEFNIPQSQLDFLSKMKPIASYGIILNTILENPKVYEKELTAIAKEKGTETKGLETMDFQIALFDSIPMTKQINMFYKSDFEKEIQKQINTYKNQDINQMYHSVKSSEYGNLEKQLLTRRNQKWADTLSLKMTDKPVFIAVGAAHLAGENGLIPLLRSKGYSVEPVTLQFD
ncbi:MAG: TraB/GumN family protein [Bacteroidota bacterium]